MECHQAIGKAIVFIENHLKEPIKASDIAGVVPYSYYHFHRYFSVVIGESIGSYIRSRRLTQAAWELVHTEEYWILGFLSTLNRRKVLREHSRVDTV